jgi:hypothetical protein
MKDGSVPPLVTTGDAGILGAPGTRVLFGGDGLDYGNFSGARVTLGGWCDPCRKLGVEASAFLLERRSVGFSAASDAAGNPLLAIPFFNAVTNVEDALIIAAPAAFAGNVAVSSASRLWGAEVNGFGNIGRFGRWDVDWLAGARYLDLREELGLTAFRLDLAAPGAGDTLLFSDQFETRNQFYGGQVGARGRWCCGRLDLDVVGKLALGVTHQVVDRSGQVSATIAPAPPIIDNGELFVQPSNQGRATRDAFTVIPQIQLKLGYYLTERLRVTLGYDFLYSSSVARAGDQIDRTLNLQQSPIFANPALPAGGPARPAGGVNDSDFWVHGLSLGLELRW